MQNFDLKQLKFLLMKVFIQNLNIKIATNKNKKVLNV